MYYTVLLPVVIGKMLIRSETIPTNSDFFSNRFRIVGLESVSAIGSRIVIDSGIGIDSGISSRFEISSAIEICSGIKIGSGIDIGSGIGIGSEFRTAKKPKLLINDPDIPRSGENGD